MKGYVFIWTIQNQFVVEDWFLASAHEGQGWPPFIWSQDPTQARTFTDEQRKGIEKVILDISKKFGKVPGAIRVNVIKIA